MAIVARCCLHTMYEFTAFMNMWAVDALGVSGGVAAQVAFANHSLASALRHTIALHAIICPIIHSFIHSFVRAFA